MTGRQTIRARLEAAREKYARAQAAAAAAKLERDIELERAKAEGLTTREIGALTGLTSAYVAAPWPATEVRERFLAEVAQIWNSVDPERAATVRARVERLTRRPRSPADSGEES
ncbi:MAG: hypothetical protein E6G56_15495 [Actinobacteria bacterium]|nr:MAG: hypothetical protein E6G56_15495 [Actinomycetota bacterium]